MFLLLPQEYYVLLSLQYFSGRSSCCRGRDLHQTEPKNWWVYPASWLWVGYVWIRRPCLRIPHGPDQLPSLHFSGLHTPSGEFYQFTTVTCKSSLGAASHGLVFLVLPLIFAFLNGVSVLITVGWDFCCCFTLLLYFFILIFYIFMTTLKYWVLN